MDSSPLIFEAMPPPAARRRPAQFTLPSVLNVEKRLAECPLLAALFGPDALARRCLFVGVKRTLLRTAPKSENDPRRTSAPLTGCKNARDTR